MHTEEDTPVGGDEARETDDGVARNDLDVVDAGHEETARPTWLQVMGIDLTPPSTGDEGPIADHGPSHDLVGEVDGATDQTATVATPVDEQAASDASSSSSESTLVRDVYQDQARALTRRLHRQQAKHGRLVEAVARGEADTSEIARSRGQIRATKDELDDVALLQEHVRKAAAARAARNKVLEYYRVVDATAAAMAQAVQAAQAIDAAIEALGSAVDQFRAQMQACDRLRRAALDNGGRPLLDTLTVWTQGAGLDAEILKRLRVVCVGDQDVDAAAREHRVAAWAQPWAARLIEVAREHGPVLPKDEAAGGDEA